MATPEGVRLRNASALLAGAFRMAITKTEVVSVRVPPDIKAALVAAAEAERRSLASMIEVMVLGYCREHHIAAPAPSAAKRPGRATSR